MKTLDQISTPQVANAKYPFGSTIQNETETQEGTAATRELFGDIFQNCYKILKETNITPTGIEDSDDTQYQLLEAIKKLPNSTNDIEQVLTLVGDIWSVPLDFSILPNKYFFFAKASEDYNNSGSYTIQGEDENPITFTSDGFQSGSLLLVIVNTSEVVAYRVAAANALEQIFTNLGAAVAFNDSNKLYYQEQGSLLSDVPSTNNLESILKTEMGDTDLILNDIFIIQGCALCFCFIPTGNQYFFRQFELTNLAVSFAVNLVGDSFATTDDFSPYAFAGKTGVYITNAMNQNTNDYTLTRFSYSATSKTLTLISTLNLATSFVKTTNVAIKSNLLYTMVDGSLRSYNLTTGSRTILGNYSTISGQLFGYNGSIYFGTGEVARKWF